MSRSRFRPKFRRKAASWFINMFETRPLRREFKNFARKVIYAFDSSTLLESRERVKQDYWD